MASRPPHALHCPPRARMCQHVLARRLRDFSLAYANWRSGNRNDPHCVGCCYSCSTFIALIFPEVPCLYCPHLMEMDLRYGHLSCRRWAPSYCSCGLFFFFFFSEYCMLAIGTVLSNIKQLHRFHVYHRRVRQSSIIGLCGALLQLRYFGYNTATSWHHQNNGIWMSHPLG